MGMKNSSRMGSTDTMALVWYRGAVPLPAAQRRQVQKGGGCGVHARLAAQSTAAAGTVTQRREVPLAAETPHDTSHRPVQRGGARTNACLKWREGWAPRCLPARSRPSGTPQGPPWPGT